MNASGVKAAARYGFRPYYWVYDWQTEQMTQRKYEINAERRFYKQARAPAEISPRPSRAISR